MIGTERPTANGSAYRYELSRLMPSGISGDVNRGALRGIGAASRLAHDTNNTALLASAQTAYASAVSVAFLAGGAILMLAAVTSVKTFRN